MKRSSENLTHVNENINTTLMTQSQTSSSSTCVCVLKSVQIRNISSNCSKTIKCILRESKDIVTISSFKSFILFKCHCKCGAKNVMYTTKLFLAKAQRMEQTNFIFLNYIVYCPTC